MVGARLVSRVIDLATMLVLAHILLPKDFGLVAIAMSVIYIIEAALELPVSQALVRLRVIEPAHYDTAFTLSLLRGLALGFIVCAVSWPFAKFYADSRLFPLVCLLSIAPAARGLVSPRLADFSKNLDFSPDFTMEIFAKVTAFLIAITLGLTTRSYWAIAAGTVVAPVAGTATSYVLAPYRPRLNLSALPAFSGFLGWITAAQVVSAFNWQTDRLMLGKLMSKADLGLFTAANDFATVPVMALLGPILRPLLSAFSLVKEEPWATDPELSEECNGHGHDWPADSGWRKSLSPSCSAADVRAAMARIRATAALAGDQLGAHAFCHAVRAARDVL